MIKIDGLIVVEPVRLSLPIRMPALKPVLIPETIGFGPPNPSKVSKNGETPYEWFERTIDQKVRALADKIEFKPTEGVENGGIK